MTRLTTKDSIMGRKHDIKCGCASVWKTKLKNYRYELIEDVVDKLGQLEDIEEELGIDLVTLFKALKNGVYYFTRGMQLTKDYVGLIDDYISNGARDKLSYSLMTGFEKQTLSVKDYGITWALTKEELL